MKERKTEKMREKTMYICSPYKGFGLKKVRNIRYAKKLTKEAIRRGYNPITPHLYLPKVLKEWRKKNRETGLNIGSKLLEQCDSILIGTKYGISEGMHREIEQSKLMNVVMVESSHNKKSITKALKARYKMLERKEKQQDLKLQKKTRKKIKLKDSKTHLKLSIKCLLSIMKQEV